MSFLIALFPSLPQTRFDCEPRISLPTLQQRPPQQHRRRRPQALVCRRRQRKGRRVQRDVVGGVCSSSGRREGARSSRCLVLWMARLLLRLLDARRNIKKFSSGKKDEGRRASAFLPFSFARKICFRLQSRSRLRISHYGRNT